MAALPFTIMYVNMPEGAADLWKKLIQDAADAGFVRLKETAEMWFQNGMYCWAFTPVNGETLTWVIGAANSRAFTISSAPNPHNMNASYRVEDLRPGLYKIYDRDKTNPSYTYTSHGVDGIGSLLDVPMVIFFFEGEEDCPNNTMAFFSHKGFLGDISRDTLESLDKELCQEGVVIDKLVFHRFVEFSLPAIGELDIYLSRNNGAERSLWSLKFIQRDETGPLL